MKKVFLLITCLFVSMCGHVNAQTKTSLLDSCLSLGKYAYQTLNALGCDSMPSISPNDTGIMYLKKNTSGPQSILYSIYKNNIFEGYQILSIDLKNKNMILMEFDVFTLDAVEYDILSTGVSQKRYLIWDENKNTLIEKMKLPLKNSDNQKIEDLLTKWRIYINNTYCYPLYRSHG